MTNLKSVFGEKDGLGQQLSLVCSGCNVQIALRKAVDSVFYLAQGQLTGNLSDNVIRSSHNGYTCMFEIVDSYNWPTHLSFKSFNISG